MFRNYDHNTIMAIEFLRKEGLMKEKRNFMREKLLRVFPKDIVNLIDFFGIEYDHFTEIDDANRIYFDKKIEEYIENNGRYYSDEGNSGKYVPCDQDCCEGWDPEYDRCLCDNVKIHWCFEGNFYDKGYVYPSAL